MSAESLDDRDRLFERYAAGEHVRAVRTVIDGSTAQTVDEGAHGIVEDGRPGGVLGLVRVWWGGDSFVTSAENLEPVHRTPNRGEGP